MSARLDPAVLRPEPSTALAGEGQRRAKPAAAVYRLAGRLATGFALASSFLTAAALAIAVSIAPSQGPIGSTDFAHLAASRAALCVYLLMAACATVSLAWNHWLAPIALRGVAPAGAALTLLALATGAMTEGMPVPGLGAQLSAELVLLVTYAAYAFLRAVIRDATRADRAGAAVVLVGAANLPMIYFSVQWWDLLHLTEAVGAGRSPAVEHSLLFGLLLMTLAFGACAISVALSHMRSLMLHSGLVPRALASGDSS